MFTGQYFDSEIDEYYLRARQYDPHIARFTARDPIFGQFEEPLTLHAYLYCGNDPLNYVDPSGLWMKPHDFDDTQKIINQTTWLVGTHFAIGPLVAFGPVGPYAHGIFDFKDLLVMIKEIMGSRIEIEYKPVDDKNCPYDTGIHYEITPYNFSPKLAKKIVGDHYIDLGQGILDTLNHIYKKNTEVKTT